MGNAVLHLDARGLLELSEAVDRLLSTTNVVDERRPYLLVAFPAQPIALAFSADELFELSELVAEALGTLAGWDIEEQVLRELSHPQH